MTTLSLWLFWGYVAMLLGIGASGIFIAPWELGSFFKVPLDGLEKRAHATFLSQYRFLKGMELGYGIFAVVFRQQVFTQPLYHQFFLVVLFAGAGARVLSMIIDGRPSNFFIVVTAYELATGVMMIITGPPLVMG
ncbi:MAG: DUF4345 family protein [bacterium]